LLGLVVSSAAHAQAWDAYINRDNFFTVNLPDDPTASETPYKTAKGTMLTQRTFTATAPADSILAGKYSVNVVDYTNAKDELKTAIEEAAASMRVKGTVKYEGVNMLDNHRSWRMTIETADKHRLLVEILAAANNRLYYTVADTPLSSASPAQFQASLQILDANGLRIRNRQVEPVSADEVVPVTPQSRALEVARMVALVKGTWKAPGGSCEAAYVKVGAQTKTKRGEDSLEGTVTNMGQVINGQLIIQGPREGQFINPTTDMVVFLFDTKPGDKLAFFAIGTPAIGWPDVTVDLCPGSRG
jgi:hypothetical protein